jgi:hypothetical protein
MVWVSFLSYLKLIHSSMCNIIYRIKVFAHYLCTLFQKLICIFFWVTINEVLKMVSSHMANHHKFAAFHQFITSYCKTFHRTSQNFIIHLQRCISNCTQVFFSLVEILLFVTILCATKCHLPLWMVTYVTTFQI